MVLCPTRRCSYFCKWQGEFGNLKTHLFEEHKQLILKDHTIIIKKECFFSYNRSFLVLDDLMKSYFVNISYHIDQSLYLNLISLNDLLEKRKYRVSVLGGSFEGEIGGNEYVKIPLRRFLQWNEEVKLLICFFDESAA